MVTASSLSPEGGTRRLPEPRNHPSAQSFLIPHVRTHPCALSRARADLTEPSPSPMAINLPRPFEPAARTRNGDRLIHHPLADAEILFHPLPHLLVIPDDRFLLETRPDRSPEPGHPLACFVEHSSNRWIGTLPSRAKRRRELTSNRSTASCPQGTRILQQNTPGQLVVAVTRGSRGAEGQTHTGQRQTHSG